MVKFDSAHHGNIFMPHSSVQMGELLSLILKVKTIYAWINTRVQLGFFNYGYDKSRAP